LAWVLAAGIGVAGAQPSSPGASSDPNGTTNDFKFYSPDLQRSVAASWFQVNPSALPAYKLVKATP
jgi:hypothetical protein